MPVRTRCGRESGHGLEHRFVGCRRVSGLWTAARPNQRRRGSAATLTTHEQCGDSVLASQSFKVTALNASGTGTAGLSCGVGCGWNLRIQVSPDRQVMNLIDVDPVNPGNYISGVAVHY